MTPRRPRPHRLALQIYLVCAAGVAIAVCGAFLVLRGSRPPPPHGMLPDAARWAAVRLGGAWPSRAALEEELEGLRRFTHLRATVYQFDGGRLVSSVQPPLRPLSASEMAMLATTGSVQRGGPDAEHPQLALTLVRDGAPAGYALFQRDMHGPPPFLALSLAFLLVGVGVAAAYLGGTIARPLARLADTARAFGAGQLEARTGVSRRDELGTVARAFDEMADQVAALVQSQTELVANVAHELRTPIARIRVALDLAEDGDACVARDSLLEIAEDLSELERLVEDILATARMDLAAHRAPSGDPPLHLGALRVEEVVACCVDRLRNRYPQRRIDVEVAPGLPEIHGDGVLLRRAIQNLLDNARKYSGPDSVIRVRAVARDQGIAVQVIDSGEGIASEDLKRLFTPFFRADRSRARATGGVGLGLTLSRRIVAAHGGTLGAESTVGIGTTLTLTLPCDGVAPRVPSLA